jgi:hypothetical protein
MDNFSKVMCVSAVSGVLACMALHGSQFVSSAIGNLFAVAKLGAQTCDASQCASFIEKAIATNSSDTSFAFAIILTLALIIVTGVLTCMCCDSAEKAATHKKTSEAVDRLKLGLIDHINNNHAFNHIDIKKFDDWFKVTPQSAVLHLIDHTNQIPFHLFTSEQAVPGNTPLKDTMPSTFYCLLLLTLQFGIPAVPACPPTTKVEIAPAATS